MDYLIKATNDMNRLLDKQQLRDSDLAEAASIGCETLITLMQNPEFSNRVGYLFPEPLTDNIGRARPVGISLAEKTVNQFSSFLKAEKKLLTDDGLSGQLVDEMIQVIEKLQSPPREWRGDINTLFKKIEEIRVKTCEKSDSLRQKGNKAVEVSEIDRAFLKRVVYLFVAFILISKVADVQDPNYFSITSALADGLSDIITIVSALAFANQPTASPVFSKPKQIKWKVASVVALVFIILIIFDRIYPSISKLIVPNPIRSAIIATPTATPSPTPTTSTQSVQVNADVQWVNTGIRLSAGNTLAISATGSWSAGSIGGFTTPDGYTQPYPDNFLNLTDLGVCASCASTDTPYWGALIGYIGNNPPAAGSYTSTSVLPDAQQVFRIGSAFQSSTLPAGTLWLAFNDDAYSANTGDNAGQVAATITLTLSQASSLTGHNPSTNLIQIDPTSNVPELRRQKRVI